MPRKKKTPEQGDTTLQKIRKSSLFDCPEQATLRKGKFFEKNIFVIFSFLIPFALMFIAFAVMGCRPFGDKQILVTDLWHQYYPFLVDFQDKLKHGESLFWSWTQGAGTNYFALMSYYLASPLNFLTVFVPNEWLDMFLTFSVVLKIGLAGGFFAMFLRYTFKRDDISLVIFSTSFALSAFFMGYYWCEIWLDTVALTPLVVMGFTALMREGKYRLYVITLALSVLANYYVGLFTCIFMVLIFIGYSVCRWDGFKEFGKRFARIGVCSVVAILLTLFFMLPAFFGLQNTHAAGSTFPTGYQINIGSSNDFLGTMDAIRQVISNTGAFIKPATTEGLPNIACGVISLVLAIMFMVSRKIRLREKIFNGCLLLFLIMSFIIRQLDYMWHGFHFTNMIPYRFSYLVSFILVLMAFRAFQVLDGINYFDIILTALVSALVVLSCIGTQEILVIIATSGIAVLILVTLFLYKKEIIKKPVMCIILAAIVVAQSGATAYIGVKTTSVTTTYDYPRGGENTANVVDYMKKTEENTPELWRADFTSTQTLCDSSLNRFNGISMFNSMTNESFTRFAENFGLMGWLSGNRYTYAESSPVTDMFMNLKYIISRDGNFNNAKYLSEAFSSSTVKLLKNKAYIPMGMMVNDDLLNYNGEDAEDTYNVFEKQNEFFSLATGIDKDVYTKLDVVDQGHTDYEQFPVNRLDYGSYSFSSNDQTNAPHLKWNYRAPKDGYYFAYVQITDADNITVMANDAARVGTSNFYIKRPYIMSIGYFNKGDKISIYSDLDAGANGSAKVYVNLLNEDVFNKGFSELVGNAMETTSLTGSSMAGDIYASKDGLFYTSIPYESGKTEDDTLLGKLFATENEGWTATVDGKKTEITPIAHALVAFKLDKGKHSVSLRYIPKGFTKGAILTFIGLALFIGYTVLRVVKKKKVTIF
ncbi:MAG: YfhO family protein [Ruminococcus sp.]|nr:YfhO family protein [Ruminococcus sp.]